jgi:hypothetical protein
MKYMDNSFEKEMQSTLHFKLKMAESATCKVLVTGEERANLQSVAAAISYVEAQNSGKNNVKIEVTTVPLTMAQLRQSKELDRVVPKLSQFNAIIIVVDARPVYLAIAGDGGKMHNLLDKIQLFGIPEAGVYMVATGDRAMVGKEHDVTGKEYSTVHSLQNQPVGRGVSIGAVLLLYSYCTPTVLLLYSYCTVLLYCPTVLLLYSYCTPTVLLLYSYCTPTVLLLYSYCTLLLHSPTVHFIR